MDDIRQRIDRLYAAIEETEERDLSRVPAAISGNEHGIFFFQDFSGGFTPEKMSNLAHSAISLIAHLPNHFRQLAKKLGQDPAEIDNLVGSCRSISILHDLANREKHGAPREGGRSGRSPQLRGITRQCRLSGGATAGTGIQVQFTAAGPKIQGAGSATVILTGDVIARYGTRIGDFHSILIEALGAWEGLFCKWLPPNGHV